MKKTKKETEPEVDGEVYAEAEVEIQVIQPITQKFASDDLNVVVDKVNEIIALLQ